MYSKLTEVNKENYLLCGGVELAVFLKCLIEFGLTVL